MTIFRHRVRLLRALAPAGRMLPTALFVAYAVGNLVPAATAFILARLIDELRVGTGDAAFSAALGPAIMFAVVLLLGYVAESAITPLSYLVTGRIDGAVREDIARLAAGAERIDTLEGPAAQGLIREVSADRSRGVDATTASGAIAQLRWLARLLGVAASCAVLVRFGWWWLIPLVVVPAALGQHLRAGHHAELARRWRLAIKGELHADVWRRAAISPGEGKDVRVFGFADWMVRRMQHHIKEANGPFWSYVLRAATDERRQWLLVVVGLVPAYGIVSLSAARGDTTVAAQTAVFAAAWSVFIALSGNEDGYEIAGGLRVLSATTRLRRLLAAALATTAEKRPVPAATGEARPPVVRFERVSFRYPDTERLVLDELSLEIRPGELIALVGMNGAGKSTLIKLLAGLYAPTSGRITVDGRELTEIGYAEWRRRISVVFQDFVRYHLSARDNVVLGHAWREPDQAALDQAARDAGFGRLLERLPAGWDTPLARSRDGGVDLSGGQWQQVVLARALYAMRMGARLLVLDEPTAHLDVRTEFDVFNRLARIRGETSTLLISHRLSTVRQSDRIVLLDGGKVTESGTHDELMALGGTYAEMFTIQAQRFNTGYDDRIEEGDVA